MELIQEPVDYINAMWEIIVQMDLIVFLEIVVLENAQNINVLLSPLIQLIQFLSILSQYTEK